MDASEEFLFARSRARLLPLLRPLLLPEDRPELGRVLGREPELRDDPEDDPDQLLFREELFLVEEERVEDRDELEVP